jgi:glyoxylase-like metal-dependent hydrolase (beta-lactamase superfamily II)
VTPGAALARWSEGRALLHPPALFALRILAEFTVAEEVAARLVSAVLAPDQVDTRIEFQQGIRLLPLRTPTLPPATHTNAYLLGNGELLVVDPGSAEEKEYQRLLSLVAELQQSGYRPKAVVLTHHHQDHVGGAQAIGDRLGVPLWCHARTAERLSLKVDRQLVDGEVLTLAGDPEMRFRVLHTPGHAPGHLCLVDEASKAAVVGDMVAGYGTVVIDPVDGDMADYLEQLERLRDWPVGALYPAHGPGIADGQAKLSEYLAHRAAREQQILASVPPDGATLAQVVQRAYLDVDQALHPIAELSAAASLIKLEREKKVIRRGVSYFPAE